MISYLVRKSLDDASLEQPKKDKEPSAPISPLKMAVLRCLVDDELNTKKLSARLDVHQSSISHIIRDLIEEGLTIKTNHGYALTNFGKLKVHLLDFQNKAFESIERNKDFISAHDMADIPLHYLNHIGTVLNHRELLADDASAPYRNQEYLIEHLNNCRKIRCIPSAITSDKVKSVANAVKKGADVEIIISDSILLALRRHYIHILKAMPEYDNLNIYRIKEVNLSLWLTESNLFLCLRRLDGCYDLENVILCNSENGLEWGNTLFDYYRRKAEAIGNSSNLFSF